MEKVDFYSLYRLVTLKIKSMILFINCGQISSLGSRDSVRKCWSNLTF